MLSDFGPSLNFSPIAAQYDTRYQIDMDLLRSCYRRLINTGALPANGTILDAGCGTGQMSLPLAQMGCQIRGYDISPEMINIARTKVHLDVSAAYAVGDVRALPEKDQAFDGVIVSKLFMHISDWKKAVLELLRVLRHGACLVQLNDGVALENSVRTFFGECADLAGFKDRFVGLPPSQHRTLADFFHENGCEEIGFDSSDLATTKHVYYGDILNQFRDRLFAEFWALPSETYDQILSKTTDWINEFPDGRCTKEKITARIYVRVSRKARGRMRT